MFKNKNYFIPLAILLFSAFFIVACKSGQPVSEQIAENTETVKLQNSLLWEVSGKELKASSFVFGTIHLIGEEDYFLPAGSLTAIDQSNTVVFEVNIEEMNDITSQMSLLTKAFMDDDISLKDLLSGDDYEMVKNHFEDIGLPIFLFERLKPMFLTVFSSGDMNPMDFHSGKIKSYEMEFLEIAVQSGKPVGGLETLDFQMSIFDSIPYTDQARMLVESIRFSDTQGDQFKKMVEMYKTQDIDAMYEAFSLEEVGLEGYEDLLVIQRNKNWIPIMREMMKEGSVFFAVGAGHLGGKEGVINLLKKEGYKVEPYSKERI